MIRVKALVASKASHGRDALLRQIVEIEHDCELDETQSLYDDRPLPRRRAAVEGPDLFRPLGDSTEHDTASHADQRAIA